MDINVIQLVVIIILCGLAWWANEMLNKVPVLNTVIKVIIVVVGVVLVLQSLGVMGHSNFHISAH